jgi:NAD+ diphosphatase
MPSLIPGVISPSSSPRPSLFFAFHNDRLLVEADRSTARIPCIRELAEVGLEPVSQHYLGRLGQRHCFAADVARKAKAPDGMIFQGLRRLFGSLEEELFQVAGRAFQIVDWERTHQFCGRCGKPTRHHDTDRARECAACGLLSFPRVSPAVICLVERGREFLLARNARFPKSRYSILAGFVEPGETLEEAVAREIREEVGIEVGNIRYFGSQPWPFPHSLMVGFTARHESGEIRVDGEEIVDAGWYTPENLPELPDSISISRQIIDSFLGRHR